MHLKLGRIDKYFLYTYYQDLHDVIWLHVPAAKLTKDEIQDVDREDSNSEHSSSEDEMDKKDNNLASLKLKKMESDGEGRNYSLGEMTDLQSRLMLVTGKADAGRESIERFTSVRIQHI